MGVARVQLLGAAKVTVDQAVLTFVHDKRYQLLAYLACKGDWVAREQLANLFWPETSTQAARKNLRHLIQRTRGLGWLEGFEAELEHVRWQAQVDVSRFRDAVERSSWDEALALYQGPLLEGFRADDSPEFSDWLETERESLRERWRTASIHQAGALQERGGHTDALRILENLLRHDPLDEEALNHFMRVATEAGQRGAALRTFEGFARRLRQELNLPPPTNLEHLADTIRAHDPVLVQIATIPRAPESGPFTRPLPLTATPFVGRELVLAELTNLLEQREHHLITLVGTGGVGKTRIALQIAHEQHARQNVGFVNLVPLSTPSAIPTAIAETIGLSLQGEEPALVQVIDRIGARRMLLVIDNFEHLIAGSSYLSELAQRCPNLVMLVTSREALGLLGEQVLPIEAFLVPELAEVEFAEIPSLEAVQLFEQHAHRVRSDFRLEPDNLSTVLEICRLVEGLPLGIELAAVWVRALPVTEIAQEIAENLDFLSSHSLDRAERHRSIRAAFEHSWGLLTPDERRALRWLSVFRGGFSREAVRQAAHIPLPVLGSLIDKSLLGLNTQGRYRRHRLLHQYMQEKLAEDPEEAARASASHGQYYFRVLQDGLEGIRGPNSKSALETLEVEFENIRTAWRWAIDGHRVPFLKAGAEALMRFFDARGRYQEAIGMLGEAIARLSDREPQDQAALGTLLVHQSKFFERRGQYETAERLACQGVALLASLDERETTIWGLGNLGTIADTRGDQDQAIVYRERALNQARTLANDRLIAVCLGWVAISEDHGGNHVQAMQHHREAIYLFKKLGNRIGTVYNLSNLANIMIDHGELDEARTALYEALELARAAGELSQISSILSGLGHCYHQLGAQDQALAYTQQALEFEQAQASEGIGNQVHLLLALSEISLAQSEPSRARAYLAEALGKAWDAQELPSTMGILLHWAELIASNDRILVVRLADTICQHPASLSVDRERAQRLLEAQGSNAVSGTDPLELEGLVRQLRFG